MSPKSTRMFWTLPNELFMLLPYFLLDVYAMCSYPQHIRTYAVLGPLTFFVSALITKH